jgi:hypothetical protein
MSQHPAYDALRAALFTLAPYAPRLTRHETTMLHALVRAAVDELKAASVFPERVIVVVKSLADEAGIGFVGQGLVDHMTAWCIERYFESADRAATVV